MPDHGVLRCQEGQRLGPMIVGAREMICGSDVKDKDGYLNVPIQCQTHERPEEPFRGKQQQS